MGQTAEQPNKSQQNIGSKHLGHPVVPRLAERQWIMMTHCVPDNDVLHVSPREVWVGLEGEGDDGGGHGGGGRGAGVLHRAAVVQVRRHYLPLGGRPGTE